MGGFSKQRIAASCNVDLQSDNGVTALQLSELYEDVHSFTPPTRLLRSQVLNSLWNPLHLGVRDGMVGFSHPQRSIQLLLLFLLVLFLSTSESRAC